MNAPSSASAAHRLTPEDPWLASDTSDAHDTSEDPASGIVASRGSVAGSPLDGAFDAPAASPAAAPDGSAAGGGRARPSSPASSALQARGMLVHVGNYAVDVAAVRAVATPSPSKGHYPVAHSAIYDRVRVELELAGIGIKEELHALYGGGARYVGLAVTDLRSRQDDADVVLGWFNAHDKSKAATLLLGERVSICFNLAMHAEIRVSRKHTKHIARDLPGIMAGVFGAVQTHVALHADRMDRFRATKLDKRQGHELLLRLVETSAVGPTQLRAVREEWASPSHAEFADGWTVNRLYQAVTAQGGAISERGRRHLALHVELDRWCEESSSSAA